MTFISRRVACRLLGIVGGSGIALMVSSKSLQADKKLPVAAPISTRMEFLVKRLQNDLVEAIEEIEGSSEGEGKKFLRDSWTREEGGYGTSAVLQDGYYFEKAGVNLSVIKSPAPKPMLEQMRARKSHALDIDNKDYDMFVAGMSTVCHPRNPMAPTFHANYRYFELREKGSDPNSKPIAAWFGGGCDLTPSYLFEEDARHFHKEIKEACDKHDINYYPKFKDWCDRYFYLTHRKEGRGIGGIFFDDLDAVDGDYSPEQLFEFVKDCGEKLIPQYIPIVKKRKDLPFTDAQKQWQQLRRGRYVEFNLVIDRGTKFGLVTPGVRIESVLMSLPQTARWEYMHVPELGSWEERTVDVLKNPKQWIAS